MKIRPKVAAQTVTGTVSGFIVWLLMATIPAWHHGVPSDVQAAIPGVVAVILGFVAGYLKKDVGDISLVEQWIDKGEAWLAEIQAVVNELVSTVQKQLAASQPQAPVTPVTATQFPVDPPVPPAVG